MRLSDAQRRDFVRRGWIVVPGALSPGQLADAQAAVTALPSPPPATRGPHFHFLPWPAGAAWTPMHTIAAQAAEDLAGAPFESPDHLQVALNIPPFSHRPGGPHIDGISPPRADGAPGTFTLLAGVLLSDQPDVDFGALWVWPGTHRSAAAWLAGQGADALADAAPYPPVPMPQPQAATGKAGDLLLAHYLLGHNTGGNTAPAIRATAYFRLSARGHRTRWRDAVTDPWLEFPALRPFASG